MPEALVAEPLESRHLFSVYAPILKSLTTPEGVTEIEALASDSGLDVEDEVVRASGWVDSFPYLETHGHFTWGKHKDSLILGDIKECRLVTPEWVKSHFGEDTEVVGACVYMRGYIYPVTDEMSQRMKDAIQECCAILKVGGRLGISIEGVRVRTAIEQIAGKQVSVTYRAQATGALITPNPVNPRVRVRLLKSLSEAFADGEEEDDTGEIGVFVCKGIEGLPVPQAKEVSSHSDVEALPPGILQDLAGELRNMAKSLMQAGAGVNAAEFTGGRALGKEHDGRQCRRRKKRRKRRATALDADLQTTTLR